MYVLESQALAGDNVLHEIFWINLPLRFTIDKLYARTHYTIAKEIKINVPWQ